MKVLELHAGSRSIGKAAESLEMQVFSVDWTPYDNIDLIADIEHLTKEDIPFIPDIIWSSPDCTTYSIAAISHHRYEHTLLAKSDYANKCDRLNYNMIRLIQDYLEINPSLKYFIENPRGAYRKMPFINFSDRATVWYCRYGDDRAKPTDIFTNHLNTIFNPKGWRPRPICFNGNQKCHHEVAPRGSKTGTQGKKGSYERSKIPKELCFEILKSCIDATL
tara:strand:+ start:66 stop:725 length:660 start_codon:yes stop_codon:yes gene_type:complete